MATVLLLAVSLAHWGAGPAAGAAQERDPGTVLVLERLGRDDAAVFFFEPDVPRGRAEDEIEEAALAVGLPNRGIADRGGDGHARRLELRTTVGADAGFLRRAVSGEALRALGGSGGPGPVVLELPPDADLLRGNLEAIDGGSGFLVRGEGPVVYRIPPGRALWPVGALVAILVLPFPALRGYARRMRRAPIDPVIKVRRVRRVRTGALGAILALGVALLAVTGLAAVPEALLSEVAPAATRWPGFRVLAPPALAALVVLAAVGMVSLALRPAARDVAG